MYGTQLKTTLSQCIILHAAQGGFGLKGAVNTSNPCLTYMYIDLGGIYGLLFYCFVVAGLHKRKITYFQVP